jgi:uncharacterized protein YkwD
MRVAQSSGLSKASSLMLRGLASIPTRLWGGTVMKRSTLVVSLVLVASFTMLSALVSDQEPTQAASGGYVTTCGGENTIFLKAKEKETLVLHKQIRRENDLRHFCVHPKLQQAARAHSKDMIERDYFSHDTKGRNESACERIKRYDYQWRACAENIAVGTGTSGEPESTMQRWMDSPGHRGNILNRNLTQIGVGTYTGEYAGTAGTTMYTVDFGSPM